eukprot:GHVS01103381.1.p1 GENE.GHVS01103381.1~~GHVS01103381.1.p1  ORF type:complete len:160 (+),score=15.45 GHVS01103381.1:74-481(+)
MSTACLVSASSCCWSIRHIVMVRFITPSVKDVVSGVVLPCEDIGDSFRREIEALKETMKGGVEFEVKVRRTFTHERAKGYTHVLYSMFKSKADLSTYAGDPLHVRLPVYLRAICDNRYVTTARCVRSPYWRSTSR